MNETDWTGYEIQYQKKRTHTRWCMAIEISHRTNSRPNKVTCTGIRCRDKCQLGKRERVRICCCAAKTCHWQSDSRTT